MLWLLRHAEAVDGTPDDERPLTERGIRQATDVGYALEALGVGIDACLASPKVRARQTAELACAPLGVEVTIDQRLSGEPSDAYDLVAGLGDVLLVGHDPSFTLTLHQLTGAQVRMRKGGLAAIAKGELVTLLRAVEGAGRDRRTATRRVMTRAVVVAPRTPSERPRCRGTDETNHVGSATQT